LDKTYGTQHAKATHTTTFFLVLFQFGYFYFCFNYSISLFDSMLVN